ncbi:MAG: ABC transporter substrate-binding protein [Nitrospira sp.]|nr:ABC transporter substrate-binding protein [Nitrospira sp.]
MRSTPSYLQQVFLERCWWLVVCVLVMSPISAASAGEIAILKSSDLSYYEQAILGFRAGLPSTMQVHEYNIDGHLAQGREIGRAFRASPPTLVFAVGLKAALAAKLEIFDTPVIFCMVLNPESHGLPTSNMTGIAVRTSPATQLTAIRSILPDRRRIGVLYDETQSGDFIRNAHRLAKQDGFELVPVAVRSSEDLAPAIRILLPKIDALWLLQDQTVISESSIPFLLESTIDAKVALFTFSSTLVQQGALGALVVDPWAVGQQAARMARTQLNDPLKPAGTLHEPEHPQLALNLNTAEYLGLRLSPDVIRIAGHIFSGPGPVARESAPSDPIP